MRWVALHEVTHAVQFAGVPWLQPHLAGLVEHAALGHGDPGRRDGKSARSRCPARDDAQGGARAPAPRRRDLDRRPARASARRSTRSSRRWPWSRATPSTSWTRSGPGGPALAARAALGAGARGARAVLRPARLLARLLGLEMKMRAVQDGQGVLRRRRRRGRHRASERGLGAPRPCSRPPMSSSIPPPGWRERRRRARSRGVTRTTERFTNRCSRPKLYRTDRIDFEGVKRPWPRPEHHRQQTTEAAQTAVPPARRPPRTARPRVRRTAADRPEGAGHQAHLDRPPPGDRDQAPPRRQAGRRVVARPRARRPGPQPRQAAQDPRRAGPAARRARRARAGRRRPRGARPRRLDRHRCRRHVLHAHEGRASAQEARAPRHDGPQPRRSARLQDPHPRRARRVKRNATRPRAQRQGDAQGPDADDRGPAEERRGQRRPRRRPRSRTPCRPASPQGAKLVQQATEKAAPSPSHPASPAGRQRRGAVAGQGSPASYPAGGRRTLSSLRNGAPSRRPVSSSRAPTLLEWRDHAHGHRDRDPRGAARRHRPRARTRTSSSSTWSARSVPHATASST